MGSARPGLELRVHPGHCREGPDEQSAWSTGVTTAWAGRRETPGDGGVGDERDLGQVDEWRSVYRGLQRVVRAAEEPTARGRVAGLQTGQVLYF